MSEPFLGEIRMFGSNFAPRSWAFCDGQLLAIGQNQALFSLLGTIYGGDGRTIFALPDLRGRVPVHMGHGPGLSSRPVGHKVGSENVTLTQAQLPSHSHALEASADAATESAPTGHVLASSSTVTMFADTAPTVPMASASITAAGGGQGHPNMMPFLCVHFIIALAGIYPSRN